MYFNFFSVYIILIFYSSIAQAQNDKLRLIDEFVSPEEVQLYALKSMDIYENNMIFINAFDDNAVHYSGEEWTVLDAEVCYPGFEFRPIDGKFDKDSGEIFFSNSWGIMGFRFGVDGSCLGDAHKSFLAPTTFSSNQELYGMVIDFTNTNILRWSPEGEFIDTVFSYQNEYPNSASRFMGGGIVKSSGKLFFINSIENSLHQFDLNIGNHKSIELISKYLNHTKEDVPASMDSPRMLKAIGKFFRENTSNSNLYDFNSDNLLLHTTRMIEGKRNYYVHLISKESLEIVNEFEIEIDGGLIHAASNKLYFYKDLETELPQVKISVYEYN